MKNFLLMVAVCFIIATLVVVVVHKVKPIKNVIVGK